ncbi:hypothetical protein BGZ73_005413 [Actinomortierella ambigua]|nr:hypothetical protein BGZ73_005413 [Actinomortierella ambigua]
MTASVPPLVSCQYLKDRLDKTIVLDGSSHMPNSGRDARKEFRENGHLPGARYFDVDTIKDPTNPLPHMMPSAEQFASQVGELGISNNDHVVVYDTVGFFSAPRVYWMFKAFGHKNVSVLDGGFKAWTAAGLPIVKGEQSKIEPKEYKVHPLNKDMIRDYQQILAIVNNENSPVTVIDARPSPRFTGRAPEPRVGLSSGHMPRSKNVPFVELFDMETGMLHTPEQLEAAYKRAGVDVETLKKHESPEKNVVLSCGSGLTACVLYFSLEQLGLKNLAVYDGSWTEYASHPESPIIKDV